MLAAAIFPTYSPRFERGVRAGSFPLWTKSPQWSPKHNQRDRVRGILSGLTFRVHRPIGTPVETPCSGPHRAPPAHSGISSTEEMRRSKLKCAGTGRSGMPNGNTAVFKKSNWLRKGPDRAAAYCCQFPRRTGLFPCRSHSPSAASAISMSAAAACFLPSR